MVNKDQLRTGVLKYIDSEVIPNLPSSSKWIVGSLIILCSASYEKYFDYFVSSRAARELGIVTADKMVDINKLAMAIKTSVEKYGRIEITVPFVGKLFGDRCTMYFTPEDVDKLKEFIDLEVT